MTGEPPSDPGGDQDTVADPFPAIALTPVGAPGAVALAVHWAYRVTDPASRYGEVTRLPPDAAVYQPAKV
jgi:hypothetical protein